MGTIGELLEATEDKILQRGRAYYKGGKVLSLTRDNNGSYHAAVEGSDAAPYEVTLKLDANGQVTDYACDCPYDFGAVCKHEAAVFLAVLAGDTALPEAKTETTSKSHDLPALVEKIPDDRLRALVLDYAKRTPDFQTLLSLAAGEYDEKADLAAVKTRIKAAIRAGTHRGYIDYAACDQICDEMMSLVDLAGERLEQGYPMAAARMGGELLTSAFKLALEADDSDGGVTATKHAVLELFEAICDVLETHTGPEQTELCKFLVKLAQHKAFEDWREVSYELLTLAVKMASEKETPMLTAVLDYLWAQNAKGAYPSFGEERNQMVRLILMDKMEGREAARARLYENLNYDNFRKLAFRWAMDAKDFTEAERLSRERADVANRVQVVPWLEYLCQACEAGGNRAGQEDALARLIVAGKIAEYKPLKKMLQEDGTWEGRYPALREAWATGLDSYQYMDLLDQEGETALLMDMGERNPSSILQYGIQLANEFPERTYACYRHVVGELAKIANNRKGYARVCEVIHELHKAGGTAMALELLGEYRQANLRKPAFQDELNALEAALIAH